MTSFQDVLNKPAEAIEAPKPIPPGNYIGLIDGQPEFKKMGKNQTDCCEFKAKLIQPSADVDQNALQEALSRKDGTAKALNEIRVTIRQFLTEDSVWRVKQFLCDHLGIDPTGKTLGQMIPEAMGKQVMVTMKHEPSQDGTTVFSVVAGTAKV